MIAATKEHCFLCFQSLYNHLSNLSSSSVGNFDEIPLFVTWKKSGKLRGCIGNLSPQPFPQSLIEYAIRAGVNDSRFNPMRLEELTKCTVGVSLLVEFIPNLKWDDWEIGEHGIVLRLSTVGGEYKATFLPEVAIEQGWTKRETVEALVKKSGFSADVDDEILDRISIERFSSSKAQATYAEWRASLAN